jgi:hypothetical protein
VCAYVAAAAQTMVRKTAQEKPGSAAHWSTGTSKLRKDPHFAGKLEAIIGLYLATPERALLLCRDETSQKGMARPPRLPRETPRREK